MGKPITFLVPTANLSFPISRRGPMNALRGFPLPVLIVDEARTAKGKALTLSGAVPSGSRSISISVVPSRLNPFGGLLPRLSDRPIVAPHLETAPNQPATEVGRRHSAPIRD